MSFLTETEVRKFWKEQNIFKKTKDQNKDNKKFVFYDGPPFASGNPHHGHALAGTIKDVITRYHSQQGEDVRRVWGWDTHGVPIESKINIKLGIKSREDVEKFGIKEYNEECRKIVMSCQEKWKVVVEKQGRWIDMDNSYKTMDTSFMNSVWYVFKELHNKELIYHGVKIMSFSPGLNSPLSNNEANQNYKRVSDPSLTVQIPAKITSSEGDIDIKILVWTTTPWTLPCNLLLCVHPKLVYLVVMRTSDKQHFLVAKDLVHKQFKKNTYTVINEMSGSDLVGITYTPLFDFYKDLKPSKDNSEPFRIVSDEMVSADTGTGIVHIAPGFGQEDYNVAYNYGLISEEVLPPCPLDDNCYYTEPLNKMDILNNRFVKDCDKDIIKYLKEQGVVYNVGNIVHDYPYCYRTDTPLIYRTYPAWFIKVKQHKQEIQHNLMKTNWVPKFVRDNKYAQALDNVVDWCISRNRFWGTPMPIWLNDEGECVVVGSSMELEKVAGLEPGSITDLHPENIWHIEIPSSKPDGKPLKNVKLVLDCWFESGSMPFGQWGYPYNPNVKLEDIFPADFIAEGTDQTRGWFHSLMVLYTLLLDEAPFKNLIVNGIVQSRNPSIQGGSKKGGWMKMSKKLGNYEDIETVIDKYGADTLRLMLIQSPGVKAGDVPFDTKFMPSIHKNCYIMFQNMIHFWKQSLDIYKNMYGKPLELTNLSDFKDTMSLLDVWIIQELNEFLEEMCCNLDNYQLFPLWSIIERIIDLTSRWYIKLSKNNLKGEHSEIDMKISVNVLTYCLQHIFIMMSPLVPHMTESFYQFMKSMVNNGDVIDNINMYQYESIHMCRIVRSVEIPVDITSYLMKAMRLFINVIDQTRSLRTKHNKPRKFPIKSVIIAYNDSFTMEQLKKLENYLKPELNCDTITYCDDPTEYIDVKYQPNQKKIGQQYRKDAKAIMKHFNTLDLTPYYFEQCPVIKFKLDTGTEVEVDINYFNEIVNVKDTLDTTTMAVNNIGNIVVIMDLDVTQEMEERFIMNCLIREIQEMRKEFSLNPTDKIDITYNDGNNLVIQLLRDKYTDYVYNILHQHIVSFTEDMPKPTFTSKRELPDGNNITINFNKL